MKSISTFILVLLNSLAISQTWHVLPNAPIAPGFRHDDIYFINADTGWVCNLEGNIYRTNDGGQSWNTIYNDTNKIFRCIGFLNATKGFAGNFGYYPGNPPTDTMPIFETNDGGFTWNPIVNVNGPLPKGICGLNIVNDTVIYGVGRVYGPAYFLKSTDAGQNWNSYDMSSYALQLIDCKFFSPDTGLVIGSNAGISLDNSTFKVLYTTNGGTSWLTVFQGSDTCALCWKIYFPSRNIGYISVESNIADSVPILKSIDGGASWQWQLLSTTNSWIQGIGFLNDSVGWCGGDINNTKKTIDGGNTWTNTPFVNYFNRMRVVNDSVAYAVGFEVWKYSNLNVGIEHVNQIPEGLVLWQNSPNPFTEKTQITYELPYRAGIQLLVYDASGILIQKLVDKVQDKGKYIVDFELKKKYGSELIYVLNFGNAKLARKMVSVRKN